MLGCVLCSFCNSKFSVYDVCVFEMCGLLIDMINDEVLNGSGFCCVIEGMGA